MLNFHRIEFAGRSLKFLGGIRRQSRNSDESFDIGLDYRVQGRTERAKQYYEQQLSIAREISDRRWEQEALTDIGDVHADRREFRVAIEFYEKSLSICRELGDKDGERKVLNKLGNAYSDGGDPGRGIEYFKWARLISHDLADRKAEASALWKIGQCMAEVGDRDQAILAAEEAHKILSQVDNSEARRLRLQLIAWRSEVWQYLLKVTHGLASLCIGSVGLLIFTVWEPIRIFRSQFRRIRSMAGTPSSRQKEAMLMPDLHEVQVRHAEYCMNRLLALEALYRRGGVGIPGNVEKYEDDRLQLDAAYAWLSAHASEDKEIAELCALFPLAAPLLLDLRQPPKERIRWLECSQSAARRVKRGRDDVYSEFIGNAYVALGEPMRAREYYERHLRFTRRLGDKEGEGRTLGNLGSANLLAGNPQATINFRQESLRKCEDTHNDQHSIVTLAQACAMRGEQKRAIELYDRALATARQNGDRRDEARIIGNLGLAWMDLREVHRAIQFFEEQASIARQIGDRAQEAIALGNSGIAFKMLGEVRRSISFHEESLRIDREIGDRHGEACSLGGLGVAYDRLGDSKRAIEFFEQESRIAREIGDRFNECQALGNLGNVYLVQKDLRHAVEYFNQTLSIAREIGLRESEGAVLNGLGLAYAAVGDAKLAIEYHQQHLSIAREIGDREGEAIALGNLGSVEIDFGDPKAAIKFTEQALTINRVIGNRHSEGTDLCNLAIAYHQLGERSQAITNGELALKVFEDIEDPRREQIRQRLAEWRR